MGINVTTRGYDNRRSGANTSETVLTPEAVRTRGIARLFSLAIPDDPRLEAQPLIAAGVTMNDGSVRDLVLQASMGNTIYAFDAANGEPRWHTNLGRPIKGNRSIDAWGINVLWGILSTPVIDPAAGVLHACAWISKDGTPESGQHFLAALKLSDGTLTKPLLNLEGAVYAPPGLPKQIFASAQRKQRAALTLTQGAVLIPFGTIAESSSTARGWLIAVDIATWRIAATWCSTVTGSGGGIWQSGAGPAIDQHGFIYVMTGNGDFDPAKGDYGESIVKLQYTPPAGGNAGSLKRVSWWTPWTDDGRTGGNPEGEAAQRPVPSNVHAPMLLGHAIRLGLRMPEMATAATAEMGDMPMPVTGGTTHPDLRNLITAHMEDMAGGAWGDQDLGAGGPVLAEAADSLLACGKDGILFTVSMTQLGDTQPADLGPAGTAANYARLKTAPILYTFYVPTLSPAPANITTLNTWPGGATRHLHGTPLLWQSDTHGLMHFCGGENGNLRAWSLAAGGASTYLACSAEMASQNSPRPPGGMPGWSITLAANGAMNGIIAAMIPYADANMMLSAGRFLVFDAQSFTTYADGSHGLAVLWDSQDWGPEHAFTHPKFNRPVIWNGRIFRPCYDGRVDVYGLTPH